jgi:predicted methyltransferase MtxX (methanogen marker protein 4)
MRNMPKAHRQTVIEIFGEERLRPLGIDEAKEVISEFRFVGRCRKLGR